jgi:hypothetical protein
MTDLSTAAQAVLDAYQFAPIEDELTAAAVLRAAAEQIAVPDGQPEVTLWEIGFCAGIRSAQSGIIDIAAELEAR